MRAEVGRDLQREGEAQVDQISDSADIDQHTKTNALKIHWADIDASNNFTRPDEWINMADEPDHQEFCDREQAFFLKSIREDMDLSDWMADAVNSLRIVLAVDERASAPSARSSSRLGGPLTSSHNREVPRGQIASDRAAPRRPERLAFSPMRALAPPAAIAARQKRLSLHLKCHGKD